MFRGSERHVRLELSRLDSLSLDNKTNEQVNPCLTNISSKTHSCRKISPVKNKEYLFFFSEKNNKYEKKKKKKI